MKSSSSAACNSLSDSSFDLPSNCLEASTWPRVASSSFTSSSYFLTSASITYCFFALNLSDFLYASSFSSLSYLAIKLSTSLSAVFGFGPSSSGNHDDGGKAEAAVSELSIWVKSPSAAIS